MSNPKKQEMKKATGKKKTGTRGKVGVFRIICDEASVIWDEGHGRPLACRQSRAGEAAAESGGAFGDTDYPSWGVGAEAKISDLLRRVFGALDRLVAEGSSRAKGHLEHLEQLLLSSTGSATIPFDAGRDEVKEGPDGAVEVAVCPEDAAENTERFLNKFITFVDSMETEFPDTACVTEEKATVASRPQAGDLTTAQVAEMLNVTEEYVRDCVNAGELEGMKLSDSRNAKIRISREALEKFRTARQVGGPKNEGKSAESKPSRVGQKKGRASSAADWGVP